MSSRGRKAKKIQESIRRILFDDWDPLGLNGIAPGDEYDSFIGSIYHLLAQDASEREIIDRLYQHETKDMGLTGNRERLEPIAQKLKSLKVGL